MAANKRPQKSGSPRAVSGVKLLITATGFAVTLGGWGALAWKPPRPQADEAAPDPQVYLADLELQFGPLPTLVHDQELDMDTLIADIPRPTQQPALRSVNQPLNTAPSQSSGSAARTRSS